MTNLFAVRLLGTLLLLTLTQLSHAQLYVGVAMGQHHLAATGSTVSKYTISGSQMELGWQLNQFMLSARYGQAERVYELPTDVLQTKNSHYEVVLTLLPQTAPNQIAPFYAIGYYLRRPYELSSINPLRNYTAFNTHGISSRLGLSLHTPAGRTNIGFDYQADLQNSEKDPDLNLHAFGIFLSIDLNLSDIFKSTKARRE